MAEYKIPTNSVCVNETIKKSRFISYLEHAQDVATAKQIIMQIRQQHPDARHHCWAYIAGDPADPQILGFSDDGEPGGTAGKPMLAQLQGSGIGEIVAIVVRYYGGVLLGTGGLVKAYGGGIQQALKQLPTQIKKTMNEYQLNCDYQQLPKIESILASRDGQIVQAIYGEDITLTVRISASDIDRIETRLRDISRGALVLLPVKQPLPAAY